MTTKLFWADPYLKELDTNVAKVDHNNIMVDKTIFYALSGGQESDAGTIGSHRVVQAQKLGKEIVYTLEDGHGLQPGDHVRMTIDWERRYRLMRLHFAAEIVLELVYKHANPIEKIGAHIAQDKARIDFVWGENISRLFPTIEQEANELVISDKEIISAYSDVENERRYWEVPGFARVSCGGTHLKRKGEVGVIKLKRNNIGKGKERIEIYVS